MTPADTDKDRCVDMLELNTYITRWMQGTVQISGLMDAIRLWKAGC